MSSSTVEQAFAGFLQAFNAMDLEALDRCVTRGITLFPPAGAPGLVAGSEAVVRHFGRVFASEPATGPGVRPADLRIVKQRRGLSRVGGFQRIPAVARLRDLPERPGTPHSKALPMSDTPEEDDDLADEGPSPEELAEVRKATPQDAAAVDALILGRCETAWRKVAWVVGSLLDAFEAACPALPYVYLQLRIAELVRQGRLQARGDVMAMRHSEVRLPQAPG